MHNNKLFMPHSIIEEAIDWIFSNVLSRVDFYILLQIFLNQWIEVKMRRVCCQWKQTIRKDENMMLYFGRFAE